MCHDVLVSSFLCPIGSTFSQKLLTCDWWTKVDCSSTNRYLEVNRNNYQIDDDEMIRNAYAMISLQSTEDVTKDGLVDPDSGAMIIDYSTLGGRTVSYTSGFRRITDYPAVDSTGNDLPNGFEDYPQRNDRQILDYNRYQDKIARANAAYQNKFHLNKSRSPYHASPIIRHDYQGRSTVDNEFQNDYRKPDGFTNRLQVSYAPTVPTVTTTTRRLYSPTVPTTYRPSTLAYSKLDLLMDSSDHLYAHSKSRMTPPTIIRQDDDSKNANSRASERRYDEPKKSRSNPPKTDSNDRKDDEVRLDLEEKPASSFRINVTDTIDEDEVFRQQNDRPVVRNNDDESAEDIEAKDSIGIARTLNNPREKIAVQHQDPVIQVLKNERVTLTTLSPLPTSANRFQGSHDIDSVNPIQTLRKPDVIVINETRSAENHEDAVNSTERSPEEIAYTRSFGDRTTPLVVNGNLQQRNDDSSWESTVSVTAEPAADTTEKIVGKTLDELADRSSSNKSQATVDQNSSSTKSLPNLQSTADQHFEVPRPALFLRPPLEGFLINIPEETLYTTIDDSFQTSWSPGATTTEGPRFSSVSSGSNQNEPLTYNENINEQALIDYADEGLSVTTPNLKVHPTNRVIVETSTPIPWLVPSWHDQSLVNLPVTDIVPPIVDYNDGFGDFIPPDRDSNEHSHTTQFSHTDHVESPREPNIPTSPKNNSEAEILNRYNTGFQFTIREAIKAQAESEVNKKSPCHSSTFDERTRHCETSSVTPQIAISIPSVEEKAILIGNKATTNTSEHVVSSSNTRSSEKSVTPVPEKSSTFITRPSVTINSNIDVKESTLKAVTSRDVFQTKELEEKIEATTMNSLLHSIRPGSLRQIEEMIDRQNSPYEVSLTVKKDKDLDTSTDDFISQLIAQHQQPTTVLKEQLGDFEIVKSIEPEEEITAISQTPKLPDTSYKSLNGSDGSSLSSSNNTASQFKNPESNVSMLNLLQLMAELLKLDRLPRPFSMKDLRNTELETPTHLDLEESPFVTEHPFRDHSQTETPFRNVISKTSVFDILNIPADIAEPKTTPNVGQNKFKPKEPLNLDESFTASSLSDQSVQARTPFRNAYPDLSSFGDTLKTTSNVAFTLSPDVSPRVNSNHAADTKTSWPRVNGKADRSFHKQEILEQLTENFGQPLYRSTDSIHQSLVLDLPQVRRNLDFETGLPIKQSEHVIDEAEEDPESSTTRTSMTTTTTTQRTTTTAESERIIVETEFVPSIGFSFDTDEGRKEYVEAILGGLINDHAGDVAGGRNESSVVQLTHETPKNETVRPERYESAEDI